MPFSFAFCNHFKHTHWANHLNAKVTDHATAEMFKLTIFLVFLVLAGIYALESTNDTIEDNEIRSVKLPPIFQLPVYRKILARRNIVPEIREKDAQTDKLVPKSILDPFSSSPSGTAFDPSKVQLNSGLANITNALIKPWMHFNNRISKTASTLPELFAAKGALIGTALATPIRMYTHFINQLARSINPQIVPATRQTSLFDLPIDPRVSHVDPDHSAVLLAIRNNAELIGKQMAQMGHEIKRTGKNISSVGINLLEFSKKATETLSKAPSRLPPAPEETVPIGFKPSVNELLKLNSSVPVVSSETATLIPETFEISSAANELVSLNKSENLQPIAEVITKVPFSLPPTSSDLKIVETVSPALQPVVVSEVLPVTPVLNIVNEEVSSQEIITEPSVPAAAAAVVVTTMEMLAPVSSSSPVSVETLNATSVLLSNMTALNISNAPATAETILTEVTQAEATESSLFSEMKTLGSNFVKAELQSVAEPDTAAAASTDAQNDKVSLVDTLVPAVNLQLKF